MNDDEIIALAHKYIEFDQGKIDGATLNSELAKCRDTGELIAVGTACKMLKDKGLVISSDTPDNPLYDRSKQIERLLTSSVKEDVGIEKMTRQAYERTVHVWAIPHVITVSQKSETVWVAVGDYMGERIEVKGSSADVTAKWVEAARLRGN